MRSAFLEQAAAAVLVIVVLAAAVGSGALPALASDNGRQAPSIAVTRDSYARSDAGTANLEAARPPLGDVVTPAYVDDAPVFAHYYIWWTELHWGNKLGRDYPVAQAARPPAEIHANGCTASSLFRGNTLLDVPPELYLIDQDPAATFDLHVSQAASAGIDGFAVAWPGDGTAGQTPSSNRWNQRLAEMVAAVERHNADSGAEFRLLIAYQSRRADRSPRPVKEVKHDLEYVAREYARHPIFTVDEVSDQAMVIWMGSSSYSPAQIEEASRSTNRRLALIGNEHRLSGWQRGVADSFEGDHWYWSSQNPATNPRSFSQLRELASALHNDDKLWLAPLAPGFNISNFDLGGSCVPRRDGDTLRQIYDGNVRSRPDLWLVISWNEFLENTYVQPSLRYGTQYLDLIREIFGPVEIKSSTLDLGRDAP
jgi:hypothetical protein